MENRFRPVSDIASAIGEPARAKIVLCLILPEWWALRSLIAFKEMQWLVDDALGHDEDYQLSPEGITVFQGLGIDIQAVRARHRRFARGCLDWEFPQRARNSWRPCASAGNAAPHTRAN
jgi:hypothetical protein